MKKKTKISIFYWLVSTFGLLGLVIPTAGISNFIFMTGESGFNKAKLSIEYRIPINEEQTNFKFQIYLFQNFTNGINKQVIQNSKLSIYPTPTQKKQFTDIFENEVLEVEYDKIKENIYIQNEIDLDNEVDLFSLSKLTEQPKYPLIESSIQYVHPFLKSTKLANTKDEQIKKLTTEIIQDSQTIFEAIIKIFNWTDHHIRYVPHGTTTDNKQTLKQKQGNRESILNLILSLLRSAGIPCRFVNGISLNRSFFIQSSVWTSTINSISKYLFNSILSPLSLNQFDNLERRYPQGCYAWIEIYFPNQYWVAFDPFRTHFFTPPNLIIQNVGLDSEDTTSFVTKDGQRQPIKMNFFMQVTKELHHHDKPIKYIINNQGFMTFYPLFTKEKQNWIIKQQALITEKMQQIKQVEQMNPSSTKETTISLKNLDIISKKKQWTLELKPHSVEMNSGKSNIDVKSSPDFEVAQKIDTTHPIQIQQIDLLLYRFRSYPKGTLWLEVTSSKPEGDQQKTDIEVKPDYLKPFSSNPISLENIESRNQYQWISFTFPEDAPILKKNSQFWIHLKHNTQDIILWRGLFGNVINDHHDTRFMFQKNHHELVQTYLDADLCFKIVASIAEETQELDIPQDESSHTEITDKLNQAKTD